LSCSAGQRVDLTYDGHATGKDVERKIRHAKTAGVKLIDLGSSVPTEIQDRSNARIKEWQGNRTGMQVHLSKITLGFSGAPNGTTEYATQAAMDAARADGNDKVAFRGGATAK
jgi:hypothetical protein